jgi:steroid delta-isomerase-like uncharacterized protein
MSAIPTEVAALEGVVLTVLTHLNNGEVDDAVTRFAAEFTFKDHGMGLEFKDHDRLTEFFQKARELYPDSLRKINTIFASGDHVITEWTLRATLTEPFHGLVLRVPVAVHGTSIVRIDNEKITDWVDYYDGLTSRRTALGAHFTEWVER